MFFEGFTLTTREINGVIYRFRLGGAGKQTVMLLHGRPETHAAWHHVGPFLAADYCVICPDLHPERTPAEQASDLLELATVTGHDRLVIAGQDYGAHLACQIAAAAPERVQAVIVMEALPAPDHTGRDDMAFSLSQYDCCWFGQLHPKPESQTIPVPSEWLENPLPSESIFAPEAVADYLSASIWQYAVPVIWPVPRARLTCPLMALWANSGRIGGWYNPLTLWRETTTGEISGHPISGRHFLAEETPVDVGNSIRTFMQHLTSA